MENYIILGFIAAAFFLLGMVCGSCMEIIRLEKLDKEGGAEL